MRPLTPLLVLALVAVLAPAARSVTVTVPDDYATIGAAIASGADIVKVRSGTYAENVVLSRGLELRAADPQLLGMTLPFPTISGTITLNQPDGSGGGPIVVSGFHVTGAVTHVIGQAKGAILRECALDHGVASNGLLVGGLSLRGCRVRGDISVNPMYFEMTCTTVINGTVTTNYEGGASIRYNYFDGDGIADLAMYVTSDDGGCTITENVIRDAGAGVVLAKPSGTTVTHNDVFDVEGDAFRVDATGALSAGATLQHNFVRNAGGDAFDVTGTMDVSSNTVLTVGGCGIRASSTNGLTTAATLNYNTINTPALGGIMLSGTDAWATECSHNGVFYSGGHGISLASATAVNYNTVGRSSGAGIAVSAAHGTATYRNNTSFLNGSHGFTLGGDATTSVLNNIGYGNQSYGMRWTGTGTPARGCNDWFGNLAGAVTGTTPGATDFFVNPLFCDLPSNNVWLATSSPLVGTPACGQIGSHGIGCGPPVGVLPSEGALSFSAGARPALGPVTFSWSPLRGAGRLEVFDASGTRVWSLRLREGETGARWGEVGSGAPAAPGVYFARLRCGSREERQRVVILR